MLLVERLTLVWITFCQSINQYSDSPPLSEVCCKSLVPRFSLLHLAGDSISISLLSFSYFDSMLRISTLYGSSLG